MVVKWCRILGGTLWSQVPRVTERIGVPELAEFPSIGAGKLVKVSEPRRGLSARFMINHETHTYWVTTLGMVTLQRTETRGPSAFLWEGQSGCTPDPGTALSAGALQKTGKHGPSDFHWEGWSRCINDWATALGCRDPEKDSGR